MPQVFPNEGLTDLLSYWIGKQSNAFASWQLMLWKNDITPDQDTVYADLTEAAFVGYSRVTINPATWVSPIIDDDKAVTTYGTDPVTWNVTSGTETIYGYALITPTSPVIRSIERFADPVLVGAGGIIGVLPRITFTTEPT